jgi:hypothetical protein
MLELHVLLAKSVRCSLSLSGGAGKRRKPLDCGGDVL